MIGIILYIFTFVESSVHCSVCKTRLMKVLFFSAWYPHKADPMLGLFVRNHALAVKDFVEVFVIAVVAVDKQTNRYETEIKTTPNLVEILLYYRNCKIPILAKLINGFRFVLSYIAGWKVLKSTYGKPDLVHVNVLTKAGIMALCLKWLYHIPYVITEHWSRYYPFNQGFRGFFHKWITHLVIKQAKAMSTVSLSLRDAMQNSGLSHHHWQIIPNVIDTERFNITPTPETLSKIRCYHISCFEERSKNMSGILRAFKIALQQLPTLELLMIGQGQDWEATKKLTVDLEISQSVQFPGVLQGKALVDTMNDCQFSILFSNYETFAIVIAESLSCGIPVVASRVAAIPEILPNEFGILVEARNEQALAEAIISMATDYKKYDKEAMHQFISSTYDHRSVGFQLYKFYLSE